MCIVFDSHLVERKSVLNVTLTSKERNMNMNIIWDKE